VKVINHLCKAIHNTALFDPNIVTRPACILWPDYERQWEPVIKTLQNELPELFILGDYDPQSRKGPAIWLRCAIAGQIKGIIVPISFPPIIYLPGYSRQNLRPVSNCPEPLKPLAELQYRGQIWSQANNKDWTVLAFLQSKQGGLGLDVAQDADSRKAMCVALPYFLDEDVDLSREKRLDKDYFNTLLSGDPDKELLKWLDQGDNYKAALAKTHWEAFLEICKSRYGFNPDNDGIIRGAEFLANHEGPWQKPWERFCEAPNRYLNIPLQIRKCTSPRDTLFWNTDDGSRFGGWPQWNEEQENDLGKELMAIEKLAPHEARKKIINLEEKHKYRRSLVWAELGDAPLAKSLEYLAKISNLTMKGLNAGTIADLEKLYIEYGWEIDYSMLKTLKYIEKEADFDAVLKVINTIYTPWLEDSARYLQNLLREDVSCYMTKKKETDYQDGDCILFVDGLRFDLAKMLSKNLSKNNFNVLEETTWAALPTVTATGKAAVTPVTEKITGFTDNTEFEPSVAATGQRVDTSRLRSLMAESGWLVLEAGTNGDGTGKAWCEFGDIDKEGHERGWKLAKYINAKLSEIRDKIISLFNAGWKRVIIVTDHGWLLLPGGLPKTDIHKSLTENKWGRCAAIKSGVDVKDLYPWYWNPTQFFTLANGINCFISGKEYAHGGISLQECLNLRLVVTEIPVKQNNDTVDIANITWKGLRCVVLTGGNSTDLFLDIREQPGNAASSVVEQVNVFRDDGTASVVISDDSLEGKNAVIVIIDEKGTLICQKNTTICGE